ncbi:Rieske 2Fe-2S domain-containing protein [Alkalihalobacillus sp. 1P02AB]|uniref:Rieske 2Fe-2S domain-containing protein n=1 Tax=Alkalihalobacillus sp. 1P02AB TaxID=3132260 RepID=UPI0039A5E3B8
MPVQDRVLRNEWIAVYRAIDLKDEPVQVTVMGERIVIFRNGEGVQAFKDLCVHRGAALSLGCVRDGNLVCPYHGWEYASNGDCVKIPQLPEGRAIPKKAKITKYSCTEQYGFVWINLEGTTPHFFPFPEIEDHQFQNVIWGPMLTLANPPRIVENFLDVGHLAFVHEGFLGDSAFPTIGDYKMHEEDGRIYSDEIAIYQPDPDGSGVAKHVYYTYEILNPLTVKFTKRDPDLGHIFSMVLTVQPVAEQKSIAFGMMSVNYDTGQTEEEMVEFQNLIFTQDKPIVENQKPEDLPLDLQTELSLVCDRVSIAYRQYLKKKGVVLGTA